MAALLRNILMTGEYYRTTLRQKCLEIKRVKIKFCGKNKITLKYD